ncbi:MAG: hypothetical protein JSS66_15420 [Armatimonadetes bacterium]|nr:hypothetical protein [Armatimonadota bacterium]
MLAPKCSVLPRRLRNAVFCLLLATPFTGLAQPAKPAMIVSTGSTFQSIDADLALNNEGAIAFTAQTASGVALYTYFDPIKGVVRVTPFGSGVAYRGVGLSSGTKPKAFVRHLVAGNPPHTTLEEWDVNTFVETTLGDSALGDFDGAAAFCDINNQGVVAGEALLTNSTISQVQAGKTRPLKAIATYSGNQLLEVQIAESNDIVFRDKNGQIVMWRWPDKATQTLANSGNGFDANTGHRPGISSDGTAIGFTGNRGSGQGVFLSVADATGAHSIPLIRIAGEGADKFTAFPDEQRVGVSSIKFGVSSYYQTVSVVFAGTKNGVTGIYYSSVTLRNGVAEKVSTPVKLIQIGDYPKDAFSPLASFTLSHPMNGEGQVAFYGTLADGRGAIFATPQWQETTNKPPQLPSVPIQMTDGTVMIQVHQSGAWMRLTPDKFGDYVNGTWSSAPSMPSGYGPTFFTSAVLMDGRLLVMGGEYNLGNPNRADTNLGTIYNPFTNSWTPLSGQGAFLCPPGWQKVGDAQCCVLPNGQFAMADPFSTNMAILNPATLVWRSTGQGKNGNYDEEGWTLMPEGSILTCDALSAPSAEKLRLDTEAWTPAGSTVNSLFDPPNLETGPSVLMPNGEVLALGGTQFTAIYSSGGLSQPGSWFAGSDFPLDKDNNQLVMADAPACLLPGGNLLILTSPGVFANGYSFFEFDGKNYYGTTPDPSSSTKSNFEGAMLMLPTGQVLFVDRENRARIYTPGAMPTDKWRPTVTSWPKLVQPGQTITVSGTQFNGLSQCSVYGDDLSDATNYPLVRFTNNVTGHVQYGRTHNHSTMGVATGGATVSTQVDLPANLEWGQAKMEVVANGIASKPVSINILAHTGGQQVQGGPGR